MKGSNSAAHTRLVKDILVTCLVHGHFACAMKVGGAFVQGKDKPFFMKFGVKGMADVLCLFRKNTQGNYFIPVWLEAKTGTGVQDEFQQSFQSDVERRGHAYFVIRDVRELDYLFKRL